jgi:hypothetical protein
MLLTFALAAAYADGPATCERLLDPTAAARAVKARYASAPGATSPVESITFKGAEQFRVTQQLDGRSIGYLRYSVPARGVMIIDDAGVLDEYQNKGVYQLLLAEALLRHPDTTVIDSSLFFTNATAYFSAWSQIPWSRRLFRRKAAQLEAIMNTPAYRIRKKLGFGRVIGIEVLINSVKFTVERD